MNKALIGTALIVGAVVALSALGAPDPMTERIAKEDTERHAAFDTLVTTTTGGDKAILSALAAGSIPSTLTATDTERIAAKVTNQLWKRRLLDHAAWIRWQNTKP